MPRRWLIAATLTAAILMTACGGEPDLTAATVPSAAPPTSVHIHEDGELHLHDVETPADAQTSHDHSEVRDVAEGQPVPALSLEVIEDPKSGWNLHIGLENFRLAPERASTGHVDGEGHMHLYIDGMKISRLYGLWHHIDHLKPGTHEIRIDLSANDHTTMAIAGEPIAVSATIVAPRNTS